MRINSQVRCRRRRGLHRTLKKIALCKPVRGGWSGIGFALQRARSRETLIGIAVDQSVYSRRIAVLIELLPVPVWVILYAFRLELYLLLLFVPGSQKWLL